MNENINNVSVIKGDMVPVPKEEYTELISIRTQYLLLENYILNSEYCSKETLDAFIGVRRIIEEVKE